MTLEKTIQKYKLPQTTSTPGLRKMTKKDIPQVTLLLEQKSKHYKLSPVFNKKDVAHWLMPRKKVVYSFVQEVDGVVLQVVSFYSLPSSIIGNQEHDHINAAFLFYTVSKEGDDAAYKMLINDALILAKNVKNRLIN